MKKEFVFGIHPVLEALHSGQEIDKILIQKTGQSEHLQEILQIARSRHLPVQKVPPEKLKRVTAKNHQGVIAFISAITFASLDNVIQSSYQRGNDPLLIMCDQITDVRNLGAIARTAECAGFQALVVPATGSAQLNNDAVKTSAGALAYLPICRDKSLAYAAGFIADNGIKLIAVTEKSNKSIYDTDLSGPLCLLLGSEDKGISQPLLAKCHNQVSIPMYGQISSLNVSVAAALAMYEAVRQRTIS